MDILDDDLGLGYMPSMMNNSRSGSMKKLTKRPQNKQKSQPKRQQTNLLKPSYQTSINLTNSSAAPKSKNKDQFEDIFDQLLTKDERKNSKQKQKPKNMNHSSSVDVFFDDVDKNSNFGKNQSSSRQKNRNTTNLNINNQDSKKQVRTSINVPGLSQNNNISLQTPNSGTKNNLSLNIDSGNRKPQANFLNDQVINDDSSEVKFGSNTRSRNKLVAQEEAPIMNIGSSMRTMKPPLRKRQKEDSSVGMSISFNEPNKNNFSLLNNNNSADTGSFGKVQPGVGLSLNIDSPKNISKQEKPSLNVNKRRSSIEQHPNRLVTMKSGLLLDDPIDDDFGIGSTRNNRSRNDLNKNQTKLTINNSTSPGPSNSFNARGVSPNSPKFERDESKSRLSANPESKLMKPPSMDLKGENNVFYDQVSTTLNHQKAHVSIDYQKEIDIMKKTHQKQLSSLRQSLDQQLSINKSTREKLMKQTELAIDQERKRSKRINEQQVSRMKEMFDWEKKRLEDSYKSQIQSLKSTIQYMRKSQNQNAGVQSINKKTQDRKQIAYLQDQLRSQRKALDDRQKILTRRQLQFQERQEQFNKMKRKQQQRIRQQEKRVLEQQAQIKRNAYDLKKDISTQKQDIAMEMAQAQMEVFKKKEKLDLEAKQLEIERSRIHQQKEELARVNRQLMDRFKQKMEQVAHQQERVNGLQAELIQKIRIIELRAKQVSVAEKTIILNNQHQNPNKTMYQKNRTAPYTKENNWVHNTQQLSHQINHQSRPYSTSKQGNQKKINQTKERFQKMEKASKTLFSNTHVKSRQKFDLQEYYMNMARYTRNRENIA